jgi:hypothetical protein
MKGRKQQIPDRAGTSPQKNRTASEGYVGGQTFMWITENNVTDTHLEEYGLLEHILGPANLNQAYNGCGAMEVAAGWIRWKSGI